MAPSSPALITAALSPYDTCSQPQRCGNVRQDVPEKHVSSLTFRFLSKKKYSILSVKNVNHHNLPPWTILPFSTKAYFPVFYMPPPPFLCVNVRVWEWETKKGKNTGLSGSRPLVQILREFFLTPYRHRATVCVILQDLISLPDSVETPVWHTGPKTIQYTCRRRARTWINYLTTQSLWRWKKRKILAEEYRVYKLKQARENLTDRNTWQKNLAFFMLIKDRKV